ncbi:MAG: Ribosome-binding factor A [Holosporales bacterium]
MSRLNLFVPEKAQSHRQERVSEEVRHALSMLCIQADFPPVVDENDQIQTLKYPVSITHVKISPDLRNVTAYFRTLTGEDLEKTKSYLNAMQSYFRHELGKRIRLRYTPNVRFCVDQLLEEAFKIDALISSAPK